MRKSGWSLDERRLRRLLDIRQAKASSRIGWLAAIELASSRRFLPKYRDELTIDMTDGLLVMFHQNGHFSLIELSR
jgi:hypothetical protein